MRLINRGVVIIKPKQPMLDWLNSQPDPPQITLDDLRQDCTAILVPDLINTDEMLAYVEPLKPWLFEQELDSWYTYPQTWPAVRTAEVFDAWFDLEAHSMVLDADDRRIRHERDFTL